MINPNAGVLADKLVAKLAVIGVRVVDDRTNAHGDDQVRLHLDYSMDDLQHMGVDVYNLLGDDDHRVDGAWWDWYSGSTIVVGSRIGV